MISRPLWPFVISAFILGCGSTSALVSAEGARLHADVAACAAATRDETPLEAFAITGRSDRVGNMSVWWISPEGYVHHGVSDEVPEGPLEGGQPLARLDGRGVLRHPDDSGVRACLTSSGEIALPEPSEVTRCWIPEGCELRCERNGESASDPLDDFSISPSPSDPATCRAALVLIAKVVIEMDEEAAFPDLQEPRD